MTAVTNCAIELFAALVPLQDARASGKIIAQVVESVRSPKLEKNTGRKAAVFVNATIAFLLALRSAMAFNVRQAKESLGGSQVTSIMADFLKVRT
jgi:hypothetical protein